MQGSANYGTPVYADDVVLFVKSEEEMRVSLRVLSEWCRERSVELNVE